MFLSDTTGVMQWELIYFGPDKVFLSDLKTFIFIFYAISKRFATLRMHLEYKCGLICFVHFVSTIILMTFRQHK